MTMESRFSYLRHRDSSTDMLKVKMSRRVSRTQKENRERLLDARRPLADVHEPSCLAASSVAPDATPMNEQKNVQGKSTRSKAAEERLKQLARWKERKVIQKEKQMQQQKPVFKTGMYRPKDTVFILPPASGASAKAKNVVKTVPAQSNRVTRSMKQQQPPFQKPLKLQTLNTAGKKDPATTLRQTRGASVKAASAVDNKVNVYAVKPKAQGPSSRLANRPIAAVKNLDKSPNQRITRSRALVLQLPQAPTNQNEHVVKPTSFAPDDFVFKAPDGLKTFTIAPLTPRSADRFLTPRFTSPVFTSAVVASSPAAKEAAGPSGSSPLKSPLRVASPSPSSPTESKHDVPYFRTEMANETDRLTALCAQWDAKVDDESIPEEMRGRIRTTVGQARLLMKERFNQFSGLVDDCELQRGEKMTTCSDLQGFWDMVYFQVEDVINKFESLKAAEGRSWAEERRPSPRQRKPVKKAVAATTKPVVSKVAAKSRLAEVKAAMRARKAAAATKSAAGDQNAEHSPAVGAQQSQPDTVVFDGGFFCVESPVKTQVCVRRSSRLSAAAPPLSSPLVSTPTPRRVTRRSLALGTPSQPDGALTPLARIFTRSLRCSPATLPATPRPSQLENTSDGTQLEKAPTPSMTSRDEVLRSVITAPSPLTLQPPQGQNAEASMLLFTPNPKDRIRPSVCPKDLMYFTPPL
ncbi:disks large-associated protein 5 isoform X2 [Stigmatopora argus]